MTSLLKALAWNKLVLQTIDDIDVTFIIDDEDYNPRVSNGVYTVGLRNPITIEDGEDIDFEIVGLVDGGDGRTVQFELDESDDIFARDSRYGYGVPTDGASAVNFDNSPAYVGGTFTIESGSGSADSRNIAKNDIFIDAEDAVLGVFEIEVEGEDLDFGDVDFRVVLNPAEDTAADVHTRGDDSDKDQPEISGLRLVLDGRTLSRSSRIEFDIPTSGFADNGTITESESFEGNFTLEDGTHDIEIVGDINDEFKEGDTIQFEITRFDDVRGSETNDRISVDTPGTLDTITVEEGEFTVVWASLPDTNAVKRANDVVFGELILDATDANDDVTVDSIELQFDGDDSDSDGRIGDTLENCQVEDESADRVSRRSEDIEDTDVVNYDLRNFEVEAGEEVSLFVVCDIDNDATVDDVYTVEFPDEGEVEYETGGRDDTFVLTTVSDGEPSPREVTISAAGSLTVNVEEDSDGNVFSVGDNGATINVGTITFEAQDDDITVEELTLVFTEPAANGAFSQFILSWEEVDEEDGDLTPESKRERVIGTIGDDKEVSLENLDIDVLESEDPVEVTVELEVEGIGDEGTGTPNQQFAVELKADSVKARSDSSGDVPEASITGDESSDERTFGNFWVQRSIPEFDHIDLPSSDRTLSSGTGEVYRFSVTARGGHVSLNQLSFDTNLSTGLTLTTAELKAYTNSSFSNELSGTAGDDGLVGTAVGTVSSGTVYAYAFGDEVRIREGQTIYFRLTGTFGGTIDDANTRTRLVSDTGDPSGSGVASASLSSARMIWSPHTVGEDDAPSVDATDLTWFNGAGLISEDRLADSSKSE